MLNNLTNFYSIIKGRMLRNSTTVAPTDIVPLGVVNPNYDGGYLPSAITVEDLALAVQPDTPTLQEVLDNNHELVNENNFQGTGAGTGVVDAGGSHVNAFGRDASATNSYIENVNAFGFNAAVNNQGSYVNAFGYRAADGNTKDNVNAIGQNAAKENEGVEVNAIGLDAALGNKSNYVNALGSSAAKDNEGVEVIAIGTNAAQENTSRGDNVVAIGFGAGVLNDAGNVVAIGTNAGVSNYGRETIILGKDAGNGNQLDAQFIISSSSLPVFADNAAAILAISLANGASAGSVYLYYDTALGAISAVFPA